MNSEELYKWMSEHKVKPKEMAERLGMDSATLSVYKSRGLPRAKQILADKIVREWDDSAISNQGLTKSKLVITVQLESDAQRRSWEDAGIISKGEFTQFAINHLNKLAESINDLATAKEDVTAQQLYNREQNNPSLINEDKEGYSND